MQIPTAGAVSLSRPYQLEHDDRVRFDRDGFVHLKGALDADVVLRYEPAITAKVIELNTEHLPFEQRSTYSKAFLQVMNLWCHSEVVREFVFGRRLAQIAAELLGVRAVRLYHDQALYKEGGGGITPWHVDQYYWPLASPLTCTAWVPLQDTPLDMGPLIFAAGTHRHPQEEGLEIGDRSQEFYTAWVADRGVRVVEEPFNLGDVSFHTGWMLHRAGVNTTSTPRRVMTIIYMDADMLVREPTNDRQREDLESWLPGLQPGHQAASHLNPVLFDFDAR
jgi:ectoine hydroxylase-related dioxygenase (phytanoyl-CoA dioxygenase family)